MATQLQIRRGTTLENNAFTGAVGEITMDTDTNSIRIHDGNTPGGVQIPSAQTADYVVEWQAPTDLNNYTWYRKYKSGWVEQGGQVPENTALRADITFPVPMANTGYTVSAIGGNVTAANNTTLIGIYARTTTSIQLYATTVNASSATAPGNFKTGCFWLVYGMAAS